MNLNSRRFLISWLMIFIAALLLYPKYTVNADEVDQKEIDIATSPHKVFFNLTNLKPGDYTSKVLTVHNNGSQDFKYLFSNKFLSGSEKFYNELKLKVKDDQGILFNGLIKDFETLDSRSLGSGESEKLYFTIEIPYELGNEFQGLSSEFQFKLFVEGTLGGTLPVDGPRLPVTGTDLYKILLIGGILFTGGVSLFLYQYKRKIDVKSK
jgi:LPXTG-motif cell wall-anchored protein